MNVAATVPALVRTLSQGSVMTDDSEAIRRVLSGDVDAFRTLLGRYQRPVSVFVGNLIADAHRREDIAQDVFLAAFRRLDTFDPKRSGFSTWLLTIARNKCLNAIKKKTPEFHDDLSPPVHTRTPYDEVLGKEWLTRLDRALDDLPPRLRTVFVLAEIMDQPIELIAEIEGIKHSSVRSRLSRAKKKLRVVLEPYAKGEL